MLQCDTQCSLLWRMCVTRGFLFVAAAVLVGQPALATQMVQLAPPSALCPADPAACPPAATVPSDTETGTGPLVAGLAGLFVLGLVFGRRRASLPEVVS